MGASGWDLNAELAKAFSDQEAFEKEQEAGWILGMCIVCGCKKNQPHDQVKHDAYDRMEEALEVGITLEYTDGTREFLQKPKGL